MELLKQTIEAHIGIAQNQYTKRGLKIALKEINNHILIERQQIVDAVNHGYGQGSKRSKTTSDQYYNQTFNDKN